MITYTCKEDFRWSIMCIYFFLFLAFYDSSNWKSVLAALFYEILWYKWKTTVCHQVWCTPGGRGRWVSELEASPSYTMRPWLKKRARRELYIHILKLLKFVFCLILCLLRASLVLAALGFASVDQSCSDPRISASQARITGMCHHVWTAILAFNCGVLISFK